MEHNNAPRISDILALASGHGLSLKEEMSFNEMGLDFQIAFTEATDGTAWVLRIPRRADLGAQIAAEKSILALVRQHLTVPVPDWQIATPTLIAYPLLTDKPVLSFDDTYEVSWHIDRESPLFDSALARVLVELHGIPVSQAEEAGIPVHRPDTLRQELTDRIAVVKDALGIAESLELRWRKWLDNDALWPDFTTFVHGDLYAGHILATRQGDITGLIDWSEGQVNDASMDFSGHLSVFGEERLKNLVALYEKLGGRVWDGLLAQATERQAASALQYGYFAVTTDSDVHREAAKAQLGIA